MTARTITVDGIEYVPADSARPDRTGSPVRIVILQRGHVMVGRWSTDGDMCSLDDAAVIRRWGTTKGLGQLDGGPTAETVLDPCGHVEFHVLAVVASISVDADAWAAHL